MMTNVTSPMSYSYESQAVVVDRTIYLSGQIGIEPQVRASGSVWKERYYITVFTTSRALSNLRQESWLDQEFASR